MLVFFFCKQKTAYEMRISDWSSDVCSSDLHVGDRRIGDPHLRAAQAIAAGDLLGARSHPRGVAARVGLSEAKAADQLARCEPGQKTPLLLLSAIGVYQVHHEAALHRTGRAIARIDALDLTSAQADAYVNHARATIFGFELRPAPHQRPQPNSTN